MLSLRTSAAMQHAAINHPDPHLRALLSLRLGQLDQGDGIDLGELVHIVVFEAGDALDQIEAALGFTPLRNDVDGTSYGDPDYTPEWEWCQTHPGGWRQFVFIHSDWGDGSILLVRVVDGMNPRLLALCKEYAGETNA